VIVWLSWFDGSGGFFVLLLVSYELGKDLNSWGVFFFLWLNRLEILKREFM
jgi:hypothetical protein